MSEVDSKSVDLVNCKYCLKQVHPKNLKAHERSPHPLHPQAKIPQIYTCDFCNNPPFFAQRSNLKKHIKRLHSEHFSEDVIPKKTRKMKGSRRNKLSLSLSLGNRNRNQNQMPEPSAPAPGTSAAAGGASAAAADTDEEDLVIQVDSTQNEANNGIEIEDINSQEESANDFLESTQESSSQQYRKRKQEEDPPMEKSIKKNKTDSVTLLPVNNLSTSKEKVSKSGAVDIPEQVMKLWNIIFPEEYLHNIHPIMKGFLLGKLKPDSVSFSAITNYFKQPNQNQIKIGNNMMYLYLLELSLCHTTIRDMWKIREILLQLSEFIQDKTLIPYVSLLCLQKIQERIQLLPEEKLSLPKEFKDNLDFEQLYKDILESTRNQASETAEFSLADKKLLWKLETYMSSVMESGGINQPTSSIQSSDLQLRSRRCSEVFQTCILYYRQGKFTSVFEALVETVRKLNAGGADIYAIAKDELGLCYPIHIHQFVADIHSIPKPAANEDLPTPLVKFAGFEMEILSNLLYKSGEKEDWFDGINIDVYNLCKAVKIPNILKFLFKEENLYSKALEARYCQDILEILIKEKFTGLFQNNGADWKKWKDRIDLEGFLKSLTEQDLVWLLHPSKVFIPDEYEVYCLLVQWTLLKNMHLFVNPAKFREYASDTNIAKFRKIAEECLCLFNIEDDRFPFIFRDGFVDLRRAAHSIFEKETNSRSAAASPMMRNRPEILEEI